MKDGIFKKIDPPVLLDAYTLSSSNKTSNLEFAYKDIKEECARELSLIKGLDGKFNVLLAFITALLTALATIINIFFNQHGTTIGLTITMIVVYIISTAIYMIFGLGINNLTKFSENKINKYMYQNHDEMLIYYINEYITIFNSAKKLYRKKSLVFSTCIAAICITLLMTVFCIIIL